MFNGDSKKKKQDERQNMTERVTFEPRAEVRKEAMQLSKKKNY